MHPTTLTLRRAQPDDDAALDRLAELEEAAPLNGEVLLAERGGAVVAALSPADGRVIADIFVPTAAEVKMLREWTAEVRPPISPRRARRPRLAFLRTAAVR